MAVDLDRVARALATYDAIAHDVHLRASPVLLGRLDAAKADVLAASCGGCIGDARELVDPRPVDLPAAPAPRRFYEREGPTHVGQVVSGGLPSASRRH